MALKSPPVNNPSKSKNSTWIIKLGSYMLFQEGKDAINEELITSLAKQLVILREEGKRVILVSSGSVAIGRRKLNLPANISKSSPKSSSTQLRDIQVAAAVGQAGLMSIYEKIMDSCGILAAQLLLTHYDLQRRISYLSTRSCLSHLLDLGVLPIINENDTLLNEEISFGDNDALAAMTANIMGADLLILLTDIDGLYTANPKLDKSAKLIRDVKVDDPLLDQITTTGGSGMGRGGMFSKIKAARIAARAGTNTIIAKGGTPDVLDKISKGENPGTKIVSDRLPSVARKRWLAEQLNPSGKLTLDNGAVTALKNKGVSLLPIGVLSVEGNFVRGDLVSCYSEQGKEIARGLTNYTSSECNKIKRLPTNKIALILGYEKEEELIHRDNLALI